MVQQNMKSAVQTNSHMAKVETGSHEPSGVVRKERIRRCLVMAGKPGRLPSAAPFLRVAAVGTRI
jgi:hypothetical protein